MSRPQGFFFRPSGTGSLHYVEATVDDDGLPLTPSEMKEGLEKILGEKVLSIIEADIRASQPITHFSTTN